MHELKETVVVVTGASSGIGRAIALAFAKEKCHLVLAARNPQNLIEIEQECQRFGAKSIAVPTDVSKSGEMIDLASKAIETYGRIDVWVNNAGIGTIGEFAETPLEAHLQVVQTNLIGAMNGCHAVLPYFKRQRRGTIINMNSLGAWLPLPYAAGYSASKFGLLGFMEALRGELALETDIHICDVHPVSVNSPGFRHAGNYTGVSVKPVPPLVEPEIVASTVVGLVQSPRAQTTIGWPSPLARAVYSLFPGLTRNLVGQAFRAYFRFAVPAPKTEGTIFESRREQGRVSGTSAALGRPSTAASPVVNTTSLMLGALAAGAGIGLFFALKQRSAKIPAPRLEEHKDYPLYRRMQGHQIARG